MLRQVLFWKLKASSKKTMDDVIRVAQEIHKGQALHPNLRGQCVGLTWKPLEEEVSIISTTDFDSFDDVMALRHDAPSQQFFQDIAKDVLKVQTFDCYIVDPE